MRRSRYNFNFAPSDTSFLVKFIMLIVFLNLVVTSTIAMIYESSVLYKIRKKFGCDASESIESPNLRQFSKIWIFIFFVKVTNRFLFGKYNQGSTVHNDIKKDSWEDLGFQYNINFWSRFLRCIGKRCVGKKFLSNPMSKVTWLEILHLLSPSKGTINKIS